MKKMSWIAVFRSTSAKDWGQSIHTSEGARRAKSLSGKRRRMALRTADCTMAGTVHLAWKDEDTMDLSNGQVPGKPDVPEKLDGEEVVSGIRGMTALNLTIEA